MLRLFAALLVLVWSTAAFPAKHGNFDQPDRPDASHAVDSGPLASGAPEGSEPAAAGSIASCTTDKEGLEQVISCGKATWNFAFGSAERAIATFAGILAASTLLLWFNTRRAANAARIAAEQIRSVERAYLFAAPTNITLDDTKPLSISGSTIPGERRASSLWSTANSPRSRRRAKTPSTKAAAPKRSSSWSTAATAPVHTILPAMLSCR